jgi:uncharacterized membrane protein
MEDETWGLGPCERFEADQLVFVKIIKDWTDLMRCQIAGNNLTSISSDVLCSNIIITLMTQLSFSAVSVLYSGGLEIPTLITSCTTQTSDV